MALEVSFRKEIASLRLGEGAEFRGEGILAVTKALLQSGVTYVGGYQGAPVSHLLDVLLQAEDLLGELGVHLQTCTNEAAAAAMLGASIHYPVRGAVTWKSIVGTNVAADALSNLASAGVTGGALIVVGEDYGEGASVIQERTHAFALKSSLWLLDPRPELPTIVKMVEKGFELSEASNTPVMLELRVRACHVFGSFTASTNVAAKVSTTHRGEPAAFNYDRLSHPPATFRQEADKVERRLPAAQRFIVDHKLNETLGPAGGDLGIVVQGGLFNVLNGRLAMAGLSDAHGSVALPTHVLNVTHPLVPEEIACFCAGKRAVLVMEEGSPEFLEQAIGQILRKADLNTALHGKDMLAKTGEYTPVVVAKGLAAFLAHYGSPAEPLEAWLSEVEAHRAAVAEAMAPLPPRPPNFCTGCPERPVFSAMKLLKRDIGPVHVAADIGCHAFATFPPFSQGHSILGYGMSLASAAAVSGTQTRRPISVMGDGGFWHNGLLTGVAGAAFNKDDSVLVIMNNGYASATGHQDIPSSAPNEEGRGKGIEIEAALRSMGLTWVRRVRTYGVTGVLKTLKEAMTAPGKGLKVIIADGECQLARQRRLRPAMAKAVAAGKRVVRTRFWVDPEVCTGDHSCMRMSGCPSLTLKPNEDPLRSDPVAHVNNDCVGCGLCGEVVHAAQLCPSFAQIDIIQNPSLWDRLRATLSRGLMRLFGGGTPSPRASPASPHVPTARGEGWGEGQHKAPAELVSAPHPNPLPASEERGAEPIRLLIAALGGEGGGVLAGWISEAAAASGLIVSRTSIPGVAQRTGATTYYIEVARASGSAPPILGLNPAPGQVDILLATELLEAARMVQAGFITPDRTLVIAADRRVYATDEKIAMGDGRASENQLRGAIERFSERFVLADLAAAAAASNSQLNVVMLGLLAGVGALPIEAQAFGATIRAEGKAVEANLRGFEAGLKLASSPSPRLERGSDPLRAASPQVRNVEARGLPPFPAEARAVLAEGVRRLTDYQNEAYAQLYLARVGRFTRKPGADGAFIRELARHLAVRMSVEDVIRVAQLKLRAPRLARVAHEAQARPGDIVDITEYMKPGPEEVLGLLPPRLGRWALARVRHDRSWPLKVKTTRLSGFVRLKLLAALRLWRPRTLRFAEEEAWVERWLALVERALAADPAAAREVVATAALVRGYADTYKRGLANWTRIMEEVVAPGLSGALPRAYFADAVLQARLAALKDPEGQALGRTIAAIVQAGAPGKLAAE